MILNLRSNKALNNYKNDLNHSLRGEKLSEDK